MNPAKPGIQRFKVGDTATFRHVITEADIKKFVEITGDDNPLHVDRAFAEKTPFKGIVAHGMLSASFISTMIGKHIPGDGALWVSQSLRFLLPVRIGDELTIHAEITKIQERQQLLDLKSTISNQYKQVILEGESQVKLLELEDSESVPAEDEQRPKVVLITGASRGIGAATAKRLAADGYKIALNYRSDREAAVRVQREIEELGGEVLLCPGDVTDGGDVQAMVAAAKRHFGTVTALVNNATAKIIMTEFGALSWDDVQKQIDTNVKGAFLCTQALLPEFLQNKYGVVVNIGTIATDSAPPPLQTAYVLAKSALQAMTKSLAQELGPKGVRCNLVAPGMTNTTLVSEIPEKARLLTKMQTPLRRLADPTEIAGAIAYLLSDEARHITGETLRVCGGVVMI